MAQRSCPRPITPEPEGRSRRSGVAALDSRGAAEPAVLLAGRVERGNPALARRSEHADHAGLRGQPRRSLCHAGPPEPAAATCRALCLRPLETGPCRAGLSCRSGLVLVFGSLWSDPAEGRSPPHARGPRWKSSIAASAWPATPAILGRTRGARPAQRNRHENLLITGPTGLGKSWIPPLKLIDRSPRNINSRSEHVEQYSAIP